ncbi:40S ribosomal protein S4 [Trachipleistophora hominis]|uniref:40S ribosomal protein S4 n=1 Tax=Trachipleistophora hominis TaxID=72359 RepID=L7JWS6_TRAHO|nr:40S ribosomal protein S4 [Trachipleistophora hominis]
MVRGPRKHLKRLAAPKSWLLKKNVGVFAPRPSTGPHRLQESIPLSLLLTDKLQYARTGKEVGNILKERMIKINGRIRTDKRFPVGIFDVLSIPKTGEHYRLLYNVAGRFILHQISEEESKFRLSIIRKKLLRKGKVPYLYTNDGASFSYCDQDIVPSDTVKVDLETGRISDFLHISVGNLAFIKKGRNMGCVGVITNIEEKGVEDCKVYLVDKKGRVFATRKVNVCVIGPDGNSWISLPENEGVKLSVFDESNIRYEGETLKAAEDG